MCHPPNFHKQCFSTRSYLLPSVRAGMRPPGNRGSMPNASDMPTCAPLAHHTSALPSSSFSNPRSGRGGPLEVSKQMNGDEYLLAEATISIGLMDGPALLGALLHRALQHWTHTVWRKALIDFATVPQAYEGEGTREGLTHSHQASFMALNLRLPYLSQIS